MTRRRTAVLPALVIALLLAACNAAGDAAPAAQDAGPEGELEDERSGDPLAVGVITATSGLLGDYGEQYLDGFDAGLAYATGGTSQIGGRTILVEVADAAGEPDEAVAAASRMVDEGFQVLAGGASSAVALELAAFAEANRTLYIAGPAAADALTGVNDYTFRSGRQTYQDVAAAATLLDDPSGSVLVLTQEGDYGQANVGAVQRVLGETGAQVDALLVPPTEGEYIGYAQQVLAADPDLLFLAWAGETTVPLLRTLTAEGVFEATTVVTGLADSSTWSSYAAADGLDLVAHYFPQAPETEANAFLVDALAAEGRTPDLFTADGFVAAQMVVHALEETNVGGVESSIAALEGWTFGAPKGQQTVRASDHAMLQPMFIARLTAEGGEPRVALLDRLPADVVAPPPDAPTPTMKGSDERR